jgi:tRNA nucleotidyltransferase (CCA-adding enzyme)
LHRRDFTINTLALRIDGSHYGELHDYWSGLNDLREGLVRVLHTLSFVDDPTRMLRAVRFEQRFNFHIEKRTQELLFEARPLLGQISGDRIRHELDHILDEDHRVSMLERMSELGLLREIHPALIWDDECRENLLKLNDLGNMLLDGVNLDLKRGTCERKLAYILWIIPLPVEKIQAILRRLRFPTTQSKVILSACQLWKDLAWMANARFSQIANRLEDVPVLAIYAAFLAARDEHVSNNLQAYFNRKKFIAPSVTGNELKNRGLPPGPVYKRILAAIRDGWLDGKIENVDQEQAFLDELIKNEPGIHPPSHQG